MFDSEWLLIDSAPMDGTAILVMRDIWPGTDSGRAEECNGHNTYVAAWWAGENRGAGAWICYMDSVCDPQCPIDPTHWQPLPRPPSAAPSPKAAPVQPISLREQTSLLKDPTAIACLINHHHVWDAETDAIEPGSGGSHYKRITELLAIGRAIISEDPELWHEDVRREFRLRYNEDATNAPAWLQPPTAQPPGDGWIPWEGGSCPVGADSQVRCRIQDEVDKSEVWEMNGKARTFTWLHEEGINPIIAYRLVQEGGEAA